VAGGAGVAGNLVVGTAATIGAGLGVTGTSALETTTSLDVTMSQYAAASVLTLRRAEGTAGSPTGSVTGDEIATLTFQGHDTAGFADAAAISVVHVDATSLAGDMGGEMRFKTSADGCRWRCFTYHPDDNRQHWRGDCGE